MFLKRFPRYLGLLAAAGLPIYCAEKRKNQVYLWGNGVYQARPDALLQFHNFTPKKISGIPSNIVKLQLGEFYQMGITEDGQLWAWETQIVDANGQSSSDGSRRNVKKIYKNVKDAKFTTGYIWILTLKGQVFQYPILKQLKDGRIEAVKLGKQREVEPLRGSSQIATGNDNLIALKKGEVWAMGDDTFGQCGTGSSDRPTFPPFSERRVSYPVKVEHLKDIVKVASGGAHCLAMDGSGGLYGWGSNSNMQLSHQEQFSRMNTPLIASFSPLKITKGLDNTDIIDVKGGGQFTIILGKNRLNQSFQVFTCGSNLKGQLGIGQIRHVRDIVKVESLSNFVLKRKDKEQRVEVSSVACGIAHALVGLNIGYVMEWGDNEHGQMGNKKRSTVYSPIIVRQFSEQEIVGVFAGHNTSAVIIKEQVKQINKEMKK